MGPGTSGFARNSLMGILNEDPNNYSTTYGMYQKRSSLKQPANKWQKLVTISRMNKSLNDVTVTADKSGFSMPKIIQPAANGDSERTSPSVSVCNSAVSNGQGRSKIASKAEALGQIGVGL